MYQKYTGIILKKFNIGEADQLLTIYTKQKGKIRAKALGIRKIKSKLGGHLQTLNEIEFETAGRGALPVLTSVRCVTLNAHLREDLRLLSLALVGAETVYRILGDEQEHPDAYEGLKGFFAALGADHGAGAVALRRFQLRLLDMLGFSSEVDRGFLNDEQTRQLERLKKGAALQRLDREVEKAIEMHMEAVLEREIKSKNFSNLVDI